MKGNFYTIYSTEKESSNEGGTSRTNISFARVHSGKESTKTIGVDQTRKSYGTDHARETYVPLSVDGMYIRVSPFKPTCLPEAPSSAISAR